MSVFDRLVFLFTNENARFRVIEHTPEGRSDLVAGVRGTTIAQGAKAIVCAIPVEGHERYVLAVLPGDRRVDMKAVARIVGGRKGRFAQASLAEELTGCVVGAIPPVAFNSSLKLGPVDIHRTHIIAPTKKSMDRYDSAVFSYRVAILR